MRFPWIKVRVHPVSNRGARAVNHQPLADVVSAVRTPIGRFLGSLAERPGVELGEIAVRAALERAQVDPMEVDAVFFGNARPAGCGPNPARQVSIGAGIPNTVPATTINMACGSGIQSILLGVDMIQRGRASCVVAGGFENMSAVPYLLPRARMGYRMGHAPVVDAMYRDGFVCPLADQVMGATAETLVREYGLSREDQDRFALGSQQKAAAAIAEGAFDMEIVPVPPDGKRTGLSADEHPRPETTLEKLAALPAVFAEKGSVTAGNSSGLTDAASAVVIQTHDASKKPLAHILDYEIAGVDPARMGIGPVPATRRLLERVKIQLGEIDVVELNEAFAAQVLACARDLDLDLERTNVHGGAIALGHPIGATGARITTTLIHALRRRSGRLGLATLCVSGGMGVSLLLSNGDS
jgi:acetyl-CoA C-acetyltransferase